MRADPSANAAIEPNIEIFPSMFVSLFVDSHRHSGEFDTTGAR
jgi:hypothetical protein